MTATARIEAPTPERLRHAGATKKFPGFFEIGGDRRTGYRYSMRDTPLGRALMRQKLSTEEFSGLKKYAIHWFAGGLQGHLNSMDLNRIYAFDPAGMSGLAQSEAQADHRQAYYQAREHLGRRPAFVADCVACFEISLDVVGDALGFRSPYRAREAALEILRDAGGRLVTLWSKPRY
jgi:hypothetical protein